MTGCSEEFWRVIYASFLLGDRLVILNTLCDLQGKAASTLKCEGATYALSIPLTSAEPKELLVWIEKVPISQEAKELCKRQVEGYANIVAAEEFGELLRSKGVKDEVVKTIYKRSQELGILITDLINLFDFEGNIC